MKGVPYKWLVLVVAVVGVFMSVLDSTIVNIAVPSLIGSFHARVSDVQWVVTAYLLALGASIPITAYLADRYGIKRVYIGSLVAFTVTSAMCGFAQNLPMLIAFRVLQGLAGGGLLPLSLALMFRAFPPAEVGRAMGYSGVPILVAPAIGPTLGGYLVEFASWRLIFFINMPVGLLGIALALAWLRDYRADERPRLDVPGLLLCTAGTVGLLYGVAEAGSVGWGSARVLIPLMAGVILLAALVVVELRSAHPLLELRLFERTAFVLPMVITWLSALALFGGTFLLPLFFQNLHGYTSFQAGMLLLPQALASAVSMPIGGRMFDRAGSRLPTILGFSLLAGATALLLLMDANTSWLVIVLILTVRGLGMGLGMMSTTTAAMVAGRGVSEARVSALVSITRQIASALAVAFLATVLQARVSAHTAAGSSLRTVRDAGAATVHGAVLGFHETFVVLLLAAIPVLILATFLHDSRTDDVEVSMVTAESVA